MGLKFVLVVVQISTKYNSKKEQLVDFTGFTRLLKFLSFLDKCKKNYIYSDFKSNDTLILSTTYY